MDGTTSTHDCKGKNDCKGQGGCKTGDQGCKGKNSCKGNGGCKTSGFRPQFLIPVSLRRIQGIRPDKGRVPLLSGDSHAC